MSHTKKITSAILAVAFLLLQFTVLNDIRVYAADGDTDIGAYEYGYTSSTPYSSPSDNYNPHLYGEDASSVYYVSPDGSDTSGNGVINNPWATIGHAASQVTAAGSVIRLAAGSWTVNERVFLAPGVSLEGAGASGASVSTITSTALTYLPTNVDNAIINLVSGSVVNGGQHISNIRFDGGDRTASQAIEIRGRNNVAVHDCVFVDFESMAVGWRTCSWQNIPNVNVPDAIPSVWVTGGRFYSNTVTNCARYDSYARGALFCGGLDGFRIYDNVMTESNIVSSGNTMVTIRGVPIKFWYYDGWMLNCKIYDNTIHKLNSAISGNDASGWPFAIESMCHYGMEICGNDIIGAIDLNFGMSGEYDGFKGYRANGDNNSSVYDYATWIHDNSIHAQGADGWSQNAVILEYDTERTIIERNVITDCASVLYFTPRPSCVISDVTFRYNQCTDIRFRGSSDADAIRIDGWDAGFSVKSLSIHNNLLLCGGEGGFGVKLSHYGAYLGSDINISNNILCGFRWNPLLVQNHSTISRLTVRNNLFYGNGGWNGVNNSSTTGNITNTAAINGYVNGNNIELTALQWNGLFENAADNDYRLKKGSAAIDAGIGFGDLTDLDGNIVPYNENAPKPAVTSVTVSPATTDVVKGGTASFAASVAGINNPAQTVTWTVEGGVTGTFIGKSGTLTVSANEVATTLTVTAASTVNPAKYGTSKVTVLPAAVVTDYTVGIAPTAQSVSYGDNVNIGIYITDSNETVFNTFDLRLNYDAAKLTFDKSRSAGLSGCTVTDDNGTLHIYGHGTARNTGTAFTPAFTAKATGVATVSIQSARVAASDSGSAQYAPSAGIVNNNATVKISGCSVTLPSDFAGASEVQPGTDYTFKAENTNYNYDFTGSSMGGKAVTVTDNSDGTFTVRNITGSLVFKSAKTGKARTVTVNGSAASDVTAVPMAIYGTDYFFTLTNDSECTYTVSVAVGGESYTDYGKRKETYSIPGDDLTGDVVITVNKTLIPPMTVNVLFTGSGAGNASGESTSKLNSDYTFTLNKASDVSYTVSALMGGAPVAVIDRNNGLYTIENITAALVITIETAVHMTEEVTEYVGPDNSRSYDFNLTVNGEHEVQASPGDVLTVTLMLRRMDIDTADLMYALRDEIRYDDNFFEIIDGSMLLKDGVKTTNIALQSGGRALYMNFLSLSGDEYWEPETLIGSFRVKVLGTSGASTLKNMNFLVSLADGSGSYASDARDVTVIVTADCTVRFETNGGSKMADKTVHYGDKLQKPAEPTREGYVFQGWYSNPDNTAPWNFDADTVTGNLTLYAAWKTAPVTGTDNVQADGFKWWIPVIPILAVLLILTVLLSCRNKKKVDLMSSGDAKPASVRHGKYRG